MLAERALDILRDLSPYGRALENHCLRIFDFSMELALINNVRMEEDLIMAGCYLHDIGLLVKDEQEKNYLRRGRAFVQPLKEKWELDDEQARVLDDVMLYNHSLAAVPGISMPGDMVRRAVHVEHSFGRMSRGLERDVIRGVFDKYPRLDFNRVLRGFFRTVLLDDGPVQVFRIFLPGR